MKTLTLLRHAKSSWKDSQRSDHQRALNSRGRRDAPVMGERLKSALPSLNFVLCSDATRTLETAHLLLPAMNLPISIIHPDSRIYLASKDALLNCIAETPADIDHVMLIGHNPGLEMLCDALVADSIERMATCAVSSYEFDTQRWGAFDSKEARLIHHDFPKSQAA